MQISKNSKPILISFFFLPLFLFSQSVQPPTIPTITVPSVAAPTMPNAPIVTTPTLSESSIPQIPAIPTITTPSPSNSTSTINPNLEESNLPENSTIRTTTTTSSPQGTTIPSSLTSELSATAIETLSTLFSNDTNAIGENPLASISSLSGLSSLLDTNQTTNTTGANTVSTNALLQEVLTKLQELEARIDTTQTTASSKNNTPIQNSSSILRFSASYGQNNESQNILNSIKKVYISKPEKDGTFLLTCDRVYAVANTVYQETFYMLFKSVKSDTFEVALSAQGKDTNSVLQQIALDSPFSATRTGNLVSINIYNSKQQLEVLLDIDFN